MPDLRVRPVQHEEIREAGDGQPQVCPAVVAMPHVGQPLTGPATDLDRRQETACLEARGEDDDVDVMLGAVLGHDLAGPDRRDRVRDQLDVVPGEGPVPAVVEQHAFAVGRVLRYDLRRQVRVVTEF